MRAPEPIHAADYLVTESTYGNRRHPVLDVETEFETVVRRTVERGGIVLIPSFAVGRAQYVLHVLERLLSAGRIPPVPVFLNSPMAIRATEIFCRFHAEHRLTQDDCERMDAMTQYVRTVEESIELTGSYYPCIIVSASGMASGGRVLHHLKGLVSDHRNSVVFVGFQAPGTRGAAMVDGCESVKIHGNYYEVNAEVVNFDALSAHADADEILAWMGNFRAPPGHTYVTHGERDAADALRVRIQDELGWQVSVPEYCDEAEL